MSWREEIDLESDREMNEQRREDQVGDHEDKKTIHMYM